MKVFLFIVLSSLPVISWAGPLKDVCSLVSTSLPAGLNLTMADKNQYVQKLKNECALKRQTEKLNHTLSSRYNITLENVAIYQALRYVQRAFYDKARYENVPVPVLYQKDPADYKLPIPQRSTEIWDNWAIGIRQLESFTQRLADGNPLSLTDIQDAHIGFYTVSNEVGKWGNVQTLGQFKSSNSGDLKWFKLEPATDVQRLLGLVKAMNNRYTEMQLLPTPNPALPDQHLLMRVRKLEDGYYLYSASAQRSAEHLENLLNFTNTMLSQALQGEHMIWQGQPYSPGQVAFIVQQFFIQLHPFNDGNGRISRLLQESILTLFGLPHGASGDIMMDDLMMSHEDYYKFAMQSTEKLLARAKYCAEVVYADAFFQAGDLTKVTPEYLDYDCRLL